MSEPTAHRTADALFAEAPVPKAVWTMALPTIVTQLIKEDNNVTVIDTNADLVRTMSTNYDVMGIVGNGSSFNILREADLKHTDMLIAVTESDEVNLLTCVIAKLNNERCHTIARVRSPHYSVESHYLQKGLNLSMIINPELDDGHRHFQLCQGPHRYAAVPRAEEFPPDRAVPAAGGADDDEQSPGLHHRAQQ